MRWSAYGFSLVFRCHENSDTCGTRPLRVKLTPVRQFLSAVGKIRQLQRTVTIVSFSVFACRENTAEQDKPIYGASTVPYIFSSTPDHLFPPLSPLSLSSSPRSNTTPWLSITSHSIVHPLQTHLWSSMLRSIHRRRDGKRNDISL